MAIHNDIGVSKNETLIKIKTLLKIDKKKCFVEKSIPFHRLPCLSITLINKLKTRFSCCSLP